MSDADLPEAPDQGEPEKKGLLSRSVGAYKQAQERAAEKQAQQVRALDERFKADEEAQRAKRQVLLDQGYELFEYRVVPVRSALVGDKMNVGEVDKTLNDWAAQGWRVKSIVETQVGGRVGPGGVSGLIIVFERRLSS